MNKHVLVLSTFYPNCREPYRTVFMKNLCNAIAGEGVKLTVVAPVPDYFLLQQLFKRKNERIPRYEKIGNLDVYHPRFFVVPRMEFLSAFTYFLSLVVLMLKHRFDISIIHAHRVYPDGLVAVMLGKVFGLTVVLTAHGSDINRTPERFGVRWQVRRAMKRADSVIGVSYALIEKMQSIYQCHIERIPCAGFDKAVFYPVMRKGDVGVEQHAGKNVIYVGALVKMKGVHDLLNAWSLVCREPKLQTNAHLTFIGDGVESSSLQARIKDEQLSANISMLGALPQETVAELVKNADVLCLPSYMEGLPNVIVEALACGVPVVAARVGGIPEVVDEDVNGFLFEPGDIQQMKMLLLRALERQWDKEIISKTVSGHTWQELAAKNVLLYERLLA